jgi:hypothetical protein
LRGGNNCWDYGTIEFRILSNSLELLGIIWSYFWNSSKICIKFHWNSWNSFGFTARLEISIISPSKNWKQWKGKGNVHKSRHVIFFGGSEDIQLEGNSHRNEYIWKGHSTVKKFPIRTEFRSVLMSFFLCGISMEILWKFWYSPF